MAMLPGMQPVRLAWMAGIRHSAWRSSYKNPPAVSAPMAGVVQRLALAIINQVNDMEIQIQPIVTISAIADSLGAAMVVGKGRMLSQNKTHIQIFYDSGKETEIRKRDWCKPRPGNFTHKSSGEVTFGAIITCPAADADRCKVELLQYLKRRIHYFQSCALKTAENLGERLHVETLGLPLPITCPSKKISYATKGLAVWAAIKYRHSLKGVVEGDPDGEAYQCLTCSKWHLTNRYADELREGGDHA